MAMVTAPWWLLGVLGGLVVVGALWVAWMAAGWAERAADWLRRDRVAPLLKDDEIAPCGLCGSVEPCEHDEPSLQLAPERTWEQMTSHQLPLTCVHGWPGESCGSAHPYEASVTSLSAARERRAPWWETEQRQAYEALGFDYPSGLMARVREAAQ